MTYAIVSKARTDQNAVKQKSYRCSISNILANQFSKGRKDHLRVESESLSAYYVIEAIHEDDDVDFRTSYKGRQRVNIAPGDEIRLRSIVPLDDKDRAFRQGDIAETLWHSHPDNPDKSELFISCPHGGDCEYNTDEMGMHLYKRLLGDGISSTLWALHGYYSSGDKDAFHRWHVKKPIKASDAYPALSSLIQNNRGFKYGIGFHIHNYDYVAVGGMASQQIRQLIANRIRSPVPSTYEIVTDYRDMDLTGKGRSMSMNYFAEDFQGVQIELPRKVAYNKFHSVPEAVADGFAHLLE